MVLRLTITDVDVAWAKWIGEDVLRVVGKPLRPRREAWPREDRRPPSHTDRVHRGPGTPRAACGAREQGDPARRLPNRAEGRCDAARGQGGPVIARAAAIDAKLDAVLGQLAVTAKRLGNSRAWSVPRSVRRLAFRGLGPPCSADRPGQGDRSVRSPGGHGAEAERARKEEDPPLRTAAVPGDIPSSRR